MKSNNTTNIKPTKANSYLFLGITAGFVFLACLFGYFTAEAGIVIPVAVCIGIVLIAIGLLLFEPFGGRKRAMN
jgi:hypothetical protein